MTIWETLPADAKNLQAKSLTNKASLDLIRRNENSCSSVNFLARLDFSRDISSFQISMPGDANSCFFGCDDFLLLSQ